MMLVETDRTAEAKKAAEAAHSTLSAGYLPDVDNLELPIRQSGRVRSVADVAGTMIRIHQGAPVTIGQVATGARSKYVVLGVVVVGFAIAFGGVVFASGLAFGLGAKDLAKEYLERTLSNRAHERPPDDLRHL